MANKEFIEFVPGIISSTTEDRHGHEVPKEALEKWAGQIRDESNVIPLTFHHSSEPVGEWVDARVISHGNSAFLSALAGIYEGHQDAVERINDGEFGGLSIEGVKYENVTEDEFESTDDLITLSVEGSQAGFVDNLIKDREVSYRFRIQKSQVGVALFEIVLENIDGIAQALIMIHAYNKYQRKVFEGDSDTKEESNKAEIQLPDGTEINLSKTSAKQVIVTLEDSGYEVMINPEEAETLSKQYEMAIEEKATTDD
ncbi:hypothetical protein RBH20_19635 [Haloarcula sp. H-GB4]|uniref:hypothetical protein n=1 Tax=Haloarcula sp. H-GB4 TaxID=3069755 RepID=UPI0027B766AE|nr:hypothetical protein [Haloarcula sp. H-GB4]MDQ2074742.1 hypothetical protein [Haloarcula sp. H-GB4]